jgi:hypothetical protein
LYLRRAKREKRVVREPIICGAAGAVIGTKIT